MPHITLTEEQIQFYKDNGYLVLPSISNPDELEAMRQTYDRLFETKAGREEGMQFDLAGTDEEGKEAALPQILMPSKYAPEILDTEIYANARAICAQLLGEGATIGGEHAIYKPPMMGAATPWHQDEAYWDPGQDYMALSIWVPLQEAKVENGCMWFVPGSHKQEVQPHHSIGHDPRVHGLEIDEVDDSLAVACPIPAGGCTIHDSRTLHFAGANTSPIPRRALILTGGLPSKPRETPRRFPWNEIKTTARDERAKQAAEKA